MLKLKLKAKEDIEPDVSVEAIEKANNLIDALIERMALKNDAALARKLKLTAPVISKMRHGGLPVTPTFLVNSSEISGMSVKEMKSIAGLPILARVRVQ